MTTAGLLLAMGAALLCQVAAVRSLRGPAAPERPSATPERPEAACGPPGGR